MSAPNLVAGTVLGNRFEVLKKVCCGGMSAIYLAIDSQSESPCVVKCLLPTNIENADQWLVREIQCMKWLGHPQIPAYLGHGEDFLAIGLKQGEIVKPTKGGDPFTAHQLALGACEPLGYAHSRGIIHRDVKRENLLFDWYLWKVVLLDFGVAAPTDRVTDQFISIDVKGAVGSATYSAPEQSLGMPADERSDIYSLGIVMFEVATGRLPFETGNQVATALKHINDPLPDPRLFNRGITEPLARIIARACEKDPADRFQSTEAMRKELLKISIKGAPIRRLLVPEVAPAPAPKPGAWDRRTAKLPVGYLAAA